MLEVKTSLRKILCYLGIRGSKAEVSQNQGIIGKRLACLLLIVGAFVLPPTGAHRRRNMSAASVFAMQYVSNGGSDSNDGFTWGLPKATIRAAISALPQSGGTVITSSDYKAAF